eukprot:4837359-Pyramimonas_sp.AAC.1
MWDSRGRAFYTGIRWTVVSVCFVFAGSVFGPSKWRHRLGADPRAHGGQCTRSHISSSDQSK